MSIFAKSITIAAVLIAGSAYADDKTGSITDDDVCRALGSLAARIMELRQTETPMSRAIEVTSKGEQSKITRHIIMMAYNEPAYRSPDNQKRAVDAFRNLIELECFKN